MLAASLEYDCTFEAPDGVVYDLTAMSRTVAPDYSLPGSDIFEYRANVCEPVLQPCRGDYTGIATQWHKYGRCVAVLGRVNPVFGGSQPPEFTYLYDGNHAAGISLLFKNGDFCYYSVFVYERKVRFDIKCDQSTEGKLLTVAEVEKCSYVFEFQSIAGCPPSTKESLSPPELKKPGLHFWLKVAGCIALAAYLCTYYYSSSETRALLAPTNLVRKQGLLNCLDASRNALAFTVVRLRHCADVLIGSKDRVSV